MIILPAIDIQHRRCVRLRQGRAEDETVFYDDPSEPARLFAEAGAQFIHVVDLDGAFQGAPKNLDTFRRIRDSVDVPFEVGGGIRTFDDIAAVLEAGASRVAIGTRAVEDTDFLEEAAARHPGQIALGLDARDGIVAVKGWTELSEVTVTDFLGRIEGIELAAIIYTDIARDGMMSGPNIPANAELARVSPYPVIASGGVTTLEDIRQLSGVGMHGAIVGRALYDGAFTLEQAIEAAGG